MRKLLSVSMLTGLLSTFAWASVDPLNLDSTGRENAQQILKDLYEAGTNDVSLEDIPKTDVPLETAKCSAFYHDSLVPYWFYQVRVELEGRSDHGSKFPAEDPKDNIFVMPENIARLYDDKASVARACQSGYEQVDTGKDFLVKYDLNQCDLSAWRTSQQVELFLRKSEGYISFKLQLVDQTDTDSFYGYCWY